MGLMTATVNMCFRYFLIFMLLLFLLTYTHVLLLVFCFSKIPFPILMPYRYKDGAKMIDAR